VFSVSRSWSHETAKRAKQPPSTCPVRAAVQKAFADSGKVYGSRRIQAALRAQGVSVGRYRIRRLMRELALTARWRRKFVHTTDSNHSLPLADNVLERRFEPERPNQAWVSDITYVRTGQGWLYLAGIFNYMFYKLFLASCLILFR